MSKRGAMTDTTMMDGGSPNKKPRGSDSHRFVVGPLVPGIVIGKGGVKVKSIRDEANVNVSVADRVPQCDDRIMVVRGEPANTCKALFMISQFILEANEKAPADKQASAEVKYLLHQVQAGAIIGKGGVTIKKMMADSGAQIRLTTDALPQSTEKACIINGTPAQIQTALELVLNLLAENPLRENTESHPYLSGGMPMQAQMGGQQPSKSLAAAAAYYGAAYAPSPYAQQMPQMTMVSSNSNQQPAGSSEAPIQFDLLVPTAAGGAIIGKGGMAVKTIKQQTQCNISVGDPDPQVGTRSVTIRGLSTHIPMALSMIRELAEPLGGPSQSEIISIPTSCSGAVIGKQGRCINEMKAISGCGIQLAEPSAEAPEMRTVNITGGMIAVQIAAFLVRQRCEQHSNAIG